jgi:hypothetical protein
VILRHDAQADAEGDGQEPRGARASPSERCSCEPARQPPHRQTDRERPQHAEEAVYAGVFAVGAPPDRDEYDDDREVGDDGEPC